MKNLRILSIIAAMAFIIGNVPVHAETNNVSIPTSVGNANDGVDFNRLFSGNSYIYYGKFAHATMLSNNAIMYYGPVTSNESEATPVLWQVMGQELDGNNTGDGKVTLLSKHVVWSDFFYKNTPASNIYSNSSVNEWLNSNESGFLKDFTSSEKSSIPSTNIVTANYKTDGTNAEVTDATWPSTTTQKIYLPWGTSNGTQNEIIYPPPSGAPTLYWSANKVKDKNKIADTLLGQTTTLKNGATKIRYWTRSPHTGSTNYALISNHVNGNLFPFIINTNNGFQMGIRPVTKLNPESIVFASEIKTTPANQTETQAVSPNMIQASSPNSNYKLTVLGNDGISNPLTMSLEGLSSGSSLSAQQGENIELFTNDPSFSGNGYSINYKIVKQGVQNREIAGYGKLQNNTINQSGADTIITVPLKGISGSNLTGGNYDLYVWLQKNNAFSSNEASQPINLKLFIEGGDSSQTPLPTDSAEPSPSIAPSVAPSASPSVSPSASPSVAPSSSPSSLPEPTPPISFANPLPVPFTSGAWQTALYPNGAGYNDSIQYASKVVDLGQIYAVNKIILNHDSSKIMSYSIQASSDGVTYYPLTNIMSGSMEKYSGRQIFRFAPIDARFIKYSATLLGTYETQAVLNSITAAFTQTSSVEFNNLSSTVNPLETSQISLSVNMVDSDGGSYTLNENGVKYSIEGEMPEGVLLDGNDIYINDSVQQSILTVKAEDLSCTKSSIFTVNIIPQISVRNFGLSSAADGSVISSLTANGNVYANAKVRSSAACINKTIKLVIGLYEKNNGNSHLTGIAVKNFDVTPSSYYSDISYNLKLPDTLPSNSFVKAILWEDGTYKPLCNRVVFAPNGEEQGLSGLNLFINKASTYRLVASASGGSICWESSDPSVASVSEAGVVTGSNEGKAVITAKVNGINIAYSRVEVKPTIYFYLLMGQSNMTGVNDSAIEGYGNLPISQGVMLLNNDNKFEQALHKYSRYSGVTGPGTYTDKSTLSNALVGGINIGYKFGENFKADNPNINIGFIVNSRAATGIDIWEKNTTTENANGFVNSVDRVRAAELLGGQLKGIMWHQGENNAGDSNYQYRLSNLIYDFRKEFDNMEIPFIAGGLNEDGITAIKTSTAAFNDKLKSLEKSVANFGFASSREPYMLEARGRYDSRFPTDVSHFCVKSQIELGNRYYYKYSEIIKHLGN